MGYTHYFTQIGDKPTPEQWNEICAKAEVICEKYKDILCAEFDNENDPPKINKFVDLKLAYVGNPYICFNGKGDDGHETFYICRNQSGFEFCKTALKPYDAAVVEVLKAVKEVCPEWLSLSSDGDHDGNGPIF